MPARRTSWSAAGGRYELVPVASNPSVLAAARQTNAFLRAVPDEHITHHVEGAVLATDSVTICFNGADIDAGAGTWSMTGVFLNIPSTASAQPVLHASARAAGGKALPRSAKRARYGLSAAASESDLRDEQVLIDTASYAAAMIGAHPDLMSLEPTSAHVVHSNYIDGDTSTVLLNEQLQDPSYGPAMPAATAGTKNATGWGTLMPVVGDDGQPMKNTLGQNKGRIQYMPVLPPRRDRRRVERDQPADGGEERHHARPDVTGSKPPTDPNADGDPTMAGSLWLRHDGIANKTVSAGARRRRGADDGADERHPGRRLWPSATSSLNGDGTVQVALSWINWGLRFLGVYVRSSSTKTDPPTPIKLSDIPEYTAGTIVPSRDASSDGDYDMFLGMLGPVFTVLAHSHRAGVRAAELQDAGVGDDGAGAVGQDVVPAARKTTPTPCCPAPS